MDEKRTKHISKFMSLVLRHQPDKIGIVLGPSGWTGIEELLNAMCRHGFPLTRVELDHVVATNDKRRFAISEDGRRIRASQGHSVDIELDYAPADPPEILYHGTVERNLASIREKGLVKGNRHHVHLSPDRETAIKVGQRYGRPVVLCVQAGAMYRDGYCFYRSDNGVWLTDEVLPQYMSEDPPKEPRNG
jgi:putative RNA 2'-phosphotransferase